jgi:hypothetical protein
MDILRLPYLFDDAFPHHGDLSPKIKRLALIMRDVNRGEADLPVQLLDLFAEPLPEKCVDVTERLVKEKRARMRRQRSSESDPLLLAAAESVRITVRQMRAPDK